MAKASPKRAAAPSRPLYLVGKGGLGAAGLSPRQVRWAEQCGFTGDGNAMLLVPADDGDVEAALLGLGDATGPRQALAVGAAARLLPAGDWRIAMPVSDPTLAAIGFRMGAYRFDRYRKGKEQVAFLALPDGADSALVERTASAVSLTRDLINTPTNDMGPAALEKAVRDLAAIHKAKVVLIAGDALLKRNFPMIHAVGRASSEAPRLIDMTWGRSGAPKVTLVGKGVCFDTGGLDIKPASGMLLMKKDMGGAANVLGLASMLMAAKLDIRLRVLIPAVENAIAGNAFRPGDILTSRKGDTVEIGNTDAEGRLILADALAYADEDDPGLLIDMATLTGAARVALGPEVPPFYTDDEALASDIATASAEIEDPLWRLPLWKPYKARLASKVADTNNVTTDGFAGSITAALFLQRFVRDTTRWAHFDIYGWNPVEKPWSPVGGEAQGIRALERVIVHRYGRRA